MRLQLSVLKSDGLLTCYWIVPNFGNLEGSAALTDPSTFQTVTTTQSDASHPQSRLRIQVLW